MKIINFKKFKEMSTTFSKKELKQLLHYFAFHRMVLELALVDIFNRCKKDGKPISKTETLEDYANTLKGERILIDILGRTESAKIYGIMEGITSDVKMVDFILKDDSIQYYKELISK